MKMFYVVEEFYTNNGNETRLVNYEIKGAFASFAEAAAYVDDVFQNKNKRGEWKACAGCEDAPVHSIRKNMGDSSIRMYVKE